jgi:hypothetical protein
VDELTDRTRVYFYDERFFERHARVEQEHKIVYFDYSAYKPFELESLSSRTSFKIKDLKLIYE